jgi:hypothetical protein
MQMNPGDISPVVLGMPLPSAATWLFIFIGLYVLHIVVSFSFWFYCLGLFEEQYADPAVRDRMNLGVGDEPFGSRLRLAALRLAEPARSRALRVTLVLDIAFWSITAAAVVIFLLYFHFVA